MHLKIAAIFLGYGVIIWQGAVGAVLGGLTLLLVLEVVIWRMFTGGAEFRSLGKTQILQVSLVITTTNGLLYAMPALFMAASASLAIKVSGVIWVLGIQIYAFNTWSRFAAFLYAFLVPLVIMLVLTVFQLATTPPVAGTMTEWAVTFLCVILLIYACIESLRHSVQTEKDLIAARAESARRLAQLSAHQRLDGLTGLLNRPAFDASLHAMLEDRLHLGGDIAVLLIDLDSFKPINDTYSHDAGDQVLQHTAQRIQRRVGENGIVGRMGGDEFICAVSDLPNTKAAVDLAKDLAAAIASPVHWNDKALRITASIGLAVTGDNRQSPDADVAALCTAADQAMFAAKTSANREPVLFEAERFAPRMSTEERQALIEGLSNGTVCPHYQPKIDLGSGRVIGFEALARWHHPDGSLRRPSEFISQIEELGLQGTFMTQTARLVVKDVQTMLDQGLDPGQVSFNVPEIALATTSGRKDLQNIVLAHPQVAKHLTFEITEDVFISRAAEAIQTSIALFRQMGVRISLDDFGTGFASFHHLNQLDIDEMKIDTTFVAGLGVKPTADVLVRGFLNIAAGLGVDVIAEGVETDYQRRELINMGCTTAQGFLFSATMDVQGAIQKLIDQTPAASR
ncbi:putative bifunctional diguanylate cyclase/phosphodiesterase [Pseudooctadecabacter jejudonensis]|nr:EAL domain-containing protein [Pseudooctadecabacter jejudonensis]